MRGTAWAKALRPGKTIMTEDKDIDETGEVGRA